MAISMTGYGSERISTKRGTYNIEVKTLNSKYFDLNLKLPKELLSREMDIRSMAKTTLVRGKIGLVIEVSRDDANSLPFDQERFQMVYQQLKNLAGEVGDEHAPLFELTLSQPEIHDPIQEVLTETAWDEIQKGINNALLACTKSRTQEGQLLRTELVSYTNKIANLLHEVEKLAPKRADDTRSRLILKLNELKNEVDYDPNRLEQELIFYREKFDITEEIVRLKKHMDYLLETLGQEGEMGKKTGFIAQEMGREINTIGSKANHSEIQRHVVQMKEELEKIKEQSLNLL